MRMLVVLAAVSACTHHTPLRHAGQEIGEEGTLNLRNGEERDVEFVGFVPEGIVVREGGQQFPIAYPYVESLEYTSRSGGAWQGFKYGTLIGMATGVLWGFAIASEVDDDEIFGEPGEAAGFGATIFGLLGMMVGTPIGAIKGKTTVYVNE